MRWNVALTVWLLASVAAASAHADVVVFKDALEPPWQNWSWGCAVNLAAPSPVHSGNASVAVTFTSGWSGLYFHTEPSVAGADLHAVRFWVHGGSSGGQRINLVVYDRTGGFGGLVPVRPAAGVWELVEVPLTSLGSPAGISGLVWQDGTGSAQPTWHVDDIVLVSRDGTPPAPGAGPALAVDVAMHQRPISPGVYGMSFASEVLASELRLPLRRWGGNHTSRYNWHIDTSNRGSDWYFENIAEEPGAADAFVSQDRRTGTRTILTVPLIGWVAARRLESHPFDCGFKVSRYGPQYSVDPWDPDCGNGVRGDGTLITGNDPTDTSVAAPPGLVQSWVEHLVSRFGASGDGGVAYYSLDNEPMLWNSTHRDVHPEPTSYDELRERTIAYAAAVKAADPSALTLGPVVWGWTAYFWSALDWAAGGDWWARPPDRLAHGDVPFIEWYLQQLAAYHRQYDSRLLDFVAVHFYPPGVALAEAGDSGRQALRLRSTRLLWDRSYVEESWIGEPVFLVPRMREWVGRNYPGTGTAVTEYNWGALDHINGALAQADVLGILGREGLDMAVLWGAPEPDQPGAFAFRMFLNADGEGHGFGDLSVQAVSQDQSKLAVYAALRSEGRSLTVMVINKTAEALASTLSFSGFAPSRAGQVFRYGRPRLDAIVREADLQLRGTMVAATFPAESITLLVVPEAQRRTSPPRGHLRAPVSCRGEGADLECPQGPPTRIAAAGSRRSAGSTRAPSQRMPKCR